MSLKICVIDNKLDRSVLNELLPSYCGDLNELKLEEKSGLEDNGTSRPTIPVTHGTLCTALLIESLEKEDILEQSDITVLSMGEASSIHSLQSLIRSLQYCERKRFDIVSVSMGMYHLLYARQMLPLLRQIGEKTIIVAAASNDFKLTYPAAFPSVLGVKRDPLCTTSINSTVKYVHDPADGIEVIAPYIETSVLRTLRHKYNLTYEGSNSILVPQVCARIAAAFVKKSEKLHKGQIAELFDEETNGNIELLQTLSTYPGVSQSNDSQPVILFPYSSQKKENILRLGKRLQHSFEEEGYACAILFDFLVNADFENGWYPLRKTEVRKCIQYYSEIVSSSTLLIFLQSELSGMIQSDFTVNLDLLSPNINDDELNALFKLLLNSLS